MKNDDFINQYIALVKSIAGKYRSSGVPFDDLVQEGLLGLLLAKEKYDNRNSVKFATYAYSWIHKKIRESVAREKTKEFTELDDNILENIHENENQKDTELKLSRSLDKIEKDILRHFFEDEMPLDEIAVLLSVRRERVRQIKQKALRKMKINAKLT
jgi:RNA polymerase primary sigma factor